MFNKNSPLVKTWVRLLTAENPVYTVDDIPQIGNLKETVLSVIKIK